MKNASVIKDAGKEVQGSSLDAATGGQVEKAADGRNEVVPTVPNKNKIASGMKHASLLLLFLTFLSLESKGQRVQPLECALIGGIIENIDVVNHFYLEKKNGDTLIVVDTFGLLKNCKKNVWNSKGTFMVVNSLPEEIKNGDRSYKQFLDRPLMNMIVIENAHLKRNRYTIRLWQPKDNATLMLEYRQCKKKSKIKILNTGIY